MTDPTLSPLDRLIAERACERLVIDFINFSDARDFDPLADLFTEDGVYARPTDPAHPIHGREAIRAAYHARPRGRITRHIVSNCVITVENATTATGFSYVTLYAAPEAAEGEVAKGEATPLIGSFRDRFVRQDGVWRIEERIGALSLRT